MQHVICVQIDRIFVWQTYVVVELFKGLLVVEIAHDFLAVPAFLLSQEVHSSGEVAVVVFLLVASHLPVVVSLF